MFETLYLVNDNNLLNKRCSESSGEQEHGIIDMIFNFRLFSAINRVNNKFSDMQTSFVASEMLSNILISVVIFFGLRLSFRELDDQSLAD